MPQPNQIMLNGPTAVYADNIVRVLYDNGFAVMADGSIMKELEKVTTIEGINYLTSQTSKCPNCSGMFVTRNEPNKIKVNNDITFCSGLCCHESGYRLNRNGDWVVNKEIGQVIKYGHKQTTKVSTASKEHPWLIGLEIEKEDKDLLKDLNDYKKGLKISKGSLIVHDGTLDQNVGFELVTHGYNLTAERKQMLADLKEMKHIIDGKVTKKCGGHISVSEHGKTSTELAKEIRPMLCFMLALYPNRMRNEKIKMMSFSECCNHQGKYQPVKLDKNGRVEMRMISAVKSHKSLIRRIKVIEWFLQEKPSLSKTINEMKEGFLKDAFSNIYGKDSWNEKVDHFKTISKWFCYDIDKDEASNLADSE